MTQEPDDLTELASEPELHAGLEHRLQRYRLGFMILAAVCLLTFLSGAAALLVALADRSQHQAHRAEQQDLRQNMAASLSRVEQVLEDAAQHRQSQDAAIDRMASQISRMDVEDAENHVRHLQRLLIRQERDFQDFLLNLEHGMYTMHMMIPHSRGWWEDYSEQMQESLAFSEARENYLLNMAGTD